MFKKLISKKLAKQIATTAARKEAQVIVGTLLTIGTHKLMRKVAKKYPALRFLKTKETAV